MALHRRTLVVGLCLLTGHDNRRADAALVNSTAHRTFADDLAASIYENDNECSSALGVSMAFSLIYPGCTGDAPDQLRDVLGYPKTDNMRLVWEGATNRMLNSSGGQCAGGEWNGVCESEAPLLKIANSVWFDDNETLDANFESVLGDFAKQIDLGADESPFIVNGWVENQTNGLIESIVPEDNPLYPPSELIAINSIYLKASWRHPFDESKTNLDAFYSSASRNEEVSTAHFMNGVFTGLPYSHDALSGYQVIKLPFASSQVSMIVVLPLTEGSESVLSRDLLSALEGLQSTQVALSVPKFKFESTYDDGLKSAIMQTGIVAPFSGGSLCGIFEDKKSCDTLFIGKIIQKTVIDVHEVGIEAAAVTAIMLGRSAPQFRDPVSMVCDHPFQFFIYDGGEDLVLFEGRVGMPAIPEVEPAAPLLNASHSEGDFWSKEFFVDAVDPPAYAEAMDPVEQPPADGMDAEPGEPESLSSESCIIPIKTCFCLIVGSLWGYALWFSF